MGKAQIKDGELLAAIVMGLKASCLKKGIAQEDFFNDTRIHISRIEIGKVNVSISTLKAIVSYFDISLTVFFQAIEC
jgi:transcriptional regulator with XRE-family HTH domain